MQRCHTQPALVGLGTRQVVSSRKWCNPIQHSRTGLLSSTSIDVFPLESRLRALVEEVVAVAVAVSIVVLTGRPNQWSYPLPVFRARSKVLFLVTTPCRVKTSRHKKCHDEWSKLGNELESMLPPGAYITPARNKQAQGALLWHRTQSSS